MKIFDDVACHTDKVNTFYEIQILKIKIQKLDVN